MKARETSVDTCVDSGQGSFVALMDELSRLNGYKASAITTDDGELLYSNSADQANGDKLNDLIREMHVVFREAHGNVEKAGFISCSELSLRTQSEVVAIHCSGKDCLVGIRVFALVKAESNVYFIQRQLRHLLPKIMNHLTWDPDNLVPLYMREMANRPPANFAVN